MPSYQVAATIFARLALIATLVVLPGSTVSWIIINAMLGCGEINGSCWMVPWVHVEIPQ
jgi:hypothetical protein